DGASTYAAKGHNRVQSTINNCPPAWYDTTHAINPQLAALAPPPPPPPTPPGSGAVNIIRTTGSGATPGTFSVNYRNEPLPLRVTAPGQNDFQPRTQASGGAGTPPYALSPYARGPARGATVNPDTGQPNGPSGSYPKCPLSPTQRAGPDTACKVPDVAAWATACANNGTCVQPADPYTPMM